MAEIVEYQIHEGLSTIYVEWLGETVPCWHWVIQVRNRKGDLHMLEFGPEGVRHHLQNKPAGFISGSLHAVSGGVTFAELRTWALQRFSPDVYKAWAFHGMDKVKRNCHAFCELAAKYIS